MARHVVGTLIAALTVCGCAASTAKHGPDTVASSGFRLIHPPDVRDSRYPGGFHLNVNAPRDAWQEVAVFPTREACEWSRTARIDASIDQARIEVGDDAKYQLPVRRAVNARCVSAR